MSFLALKQLIAPTFPALPGAEGKRAIVTDRICLSVALLFTLYASLEILGGQLDIAWIDVIFACLLFACVWLNRRGFQHLAAWATVVLGVASQAGLSSYLGPAAGAHTIFVPLVGLPLLLFDPQKKLSLTLATLLPVLTYAFLLATNFSPPGWHWQSAAPAWYSWAVPAATFLVSFLMLFHFFRAQQLAEARLQREQAKRFTTSKLSALGEMAGGVAHEINNPLTAIQLMANQIGARARKLPADPEAIERAAKHIEETVGRISKITRAMQLFARSGPEPAAFQPVSLREVLENTVILCQEKFRNHGIRLELALPEASPEVECDPVQVSHAVLNLLNNSYDAVHRQEIPGGRPWIRVRAADLGESVKVSVTDSGPPIAARLREKIFEPFFTTKDIGQGMGLGLSVSSAIAHAHGGELTLDTASGHNAFELTLLKAKPGPGGRAPA